MQIDKHILIILLVLIILAAIACFEYLEPTTERFTLNDACKEIFHKEDKLNMCKSTDPNGKLRFGEGIAQTHQKYRLNKRDDVDWPEDLYWAHVDNNRLGKFAKCKSVFWNNEHMAESCRFKPDPAVDALHRVYWRNRKNGVRKSDEEYQMYLNAYTKMI